MAGSTMAVDPRLTNEVIEIPSDDEEEQENRAGSANLPTHLGYNPQLGGDQTNYDAQLDYDRRRQKDKLKNRFEHIFAKYGRDFEGVGDEIDLENGIIVVDNGHLRGMAHEVDAGDEHGTENVEQQDEALNDTQADSEDGAANGDSDWNESEMEPGPVEEESASGSTTPAPAPAPENILDQLPSLRDSVLALQTRQRQEGGIDQHAIDALGMSIAKQLADLMSQHEKGKPKRKRLGDVDDRWAYPDIPRPPPEKRVRRSLSPLPDFPGLSPGRKSIWAPLRVPKPRKEKGVQRAASTEESSGPAIKPEDANIIPNDQLPPDVNARKCYHCGSTSNIWRRGPDGTMCNACGMYHYRYGLLRPVGPQLEIEESPSSSESSDSDSNADDAESHYSANTSRRRDELPTRKHDRFHPAEDVLILKLKEIERLSWEKIAKNLPARTAYAVQCRYSKKMHKKPIEARATLANQGYEFSLDENGTIAFTPTPLPVAFTDEEDELLLKLREEQKFDWEIIAASFPDRTPKSLEIRFNQLVKTIMKGLKHPSRIGGKRKSKNKANLRYSEEEDQLLKKLREVDKLRWSEMAEKFPGRNSMGLQKRYTRGILDTAKQRQLRGQGSAVDSTGGSDCPGFTIQEDTLILRLRNEENLSWNDIEQRFPERRLPSLQDRYQYISAQQEYPKPVNNVTSANQMVHSVDHQIREDGAQSADELLNDELEEYSPVLTTIGSCLPPGLSGIAAIDPGLLVAKAQSEIHPTAVVFDAPDHSTHTRLQPESPAANHHDDSFPSPSLCSVAGIKASFRWSKEEDALLQQLYQRGLDYEQMTSYLPGRTAKAIRCHWDFRHKTPTVRHSLPEAQGSSNTSLLRRAIDNNCRRQSTSAEAFFSGRPPVTVIDLTGEEDDLILRADDMRRPPTPSPRSRGSLPPSALTRETSAPERLVDEQRKKIPPSVFAPPRAASKAALSPVRSVPGVAPTDVTRKGSVLDGLPNVPAVFRSDRVGMLPPAASARNEDGAMDQRAQESTEDTLDQAPAQEPAAENSTDTTDVTSQASLNEVIETLPGLSFSNDPLSGTSSAENSRPTSREGSRQETKCPETPLLNLENSPPPLDTPSLPYATYITPARFHEHAHPYFVAPPAPILSSTQIMQDVPPVSVSVAFEYHAAQDSDHEDAGEAASVSQKHTRRRPAPFKKSEQLARRSIRRTTARSGNDFDITVSNVLDATSMHDKVPSGVDSSAEANVDSTVLTVEDMGPELDTAREPAVVRRKRGRPRKAQSQREGISRRHSSPVQQVRSQGDVEARENEPLALVDEVVEGDPTCVDKPVRDVPDKTSAGEGYSGIGRPRRNRRQPRRFVHETAVTDHVGHGTIEPGRTQTTLPFPDPEQPDSNEGADAQIKREMLETADLPEFNTNSSTQLCISLPEDADELSAPILLLSEPSLRSVQHSHLVQDIPFQASVQEKLCSPSYAKYSSDVNREPDSTPSPPPTRSQGHLATLSSPSIHSSTADSNIAMALPSSSPPQSVQKPVKNVYSRTSLTPRTDRSTLSGRLEHGRVHALRSRFGKSSPSTLAREYRSSSVGLAGSRKRVVYTPMRDGDESEDELA